VPSQKYFTPEQYFGETLLWACYSFGRVTNFDSCTSNLMCS